LPGSLCIFTEITEELFFSLISTAVCVALFEWTNHSLISYETTVHF